MTRGRSAGDGRVSRTVVEAVAEAEGVAPEELAPPLYDAIDPDALDRFFGTSPTAARTASRVVFVYHGYEVTVRGDGDVSVEREGPDP